MKKSNLSVCYKITKKTSLTVVLSLLSHFAIAQGPLPQIQNIGVVSPDAASIGKFGNIPVSYSTGVPDVTIPLHEVKVGHINLPVSLNYHAGGIKVDEVASSVGIGWALNAGGIVSRNMIGIPDEYNGYLTSSTPTENDLINDPGPYYTFLYNANQRSDYEPDIFSFSTVNQSGKFLFNKDQSIFQIPLSDNKIEFSHIGSTTSFKITDKDGIVYYYEGEEIQYAQVSPITAYTSAWRLTKIVDPATNEVVTLNYQQSTTESEETHDDQVTFICTPQQDPPVRLGFSVINNVPNKVNTAIQHISTLYLQDITWSKGKIHFVNSSDRTDRNGAFKVQQIQVFSLLNESYQMIKNFRLDQSYFYNGSGTGGQKNYRLRLDDVALLPVKGSDNIQYYRMTYDQTQMASRESTAQDMWGFNNGAFTNNSRLWIQQGFDYLGNAYTIGDANRDTNPAFIKACSLQSIQYPTGGKSVFELEPHVYQDPFSLTHKSITCSVNSGTAPSASSTTYAAGSIQNLTVSYTISAYDFNSQLPPPTITVVDQTTNSTVVITSPDHTRNYSVTTFNDGTNNLKFISGHTYLITTDIKTNINTGGQVSASFALNWDDNVGNPVYKAGGGLRVRSITNYNNNGNFVNKETYKYGITGEEGFGLLMTNPSLLKANRSLILNRTTYVGLSGGDASYNDAPQSYVYHSDALTSASMVNGSPVLYPMVSKYITNADESATNGKTVYTYNVVPDVEVSSDPFGEFTLSNDWQNNFMTSETVFKNVNGIYSPIQKKEYHYQLDRQVYKHQVKIIKYFTLSGNAAEKRSPDHVLGFNSLRFTYPDFRFNQYERLSGAVLLHDVKTTTWSDVGNKVIAESSYYDNPNHLQLTQKTLTDSKGDIYKTQYKYPHDFTGTQPYADMVNTLHLWSPIVEQLENVTKTVNNTTVTSFLQGMKTDYQFWNSNSAQIYPAVVSTKKGNVNNAYDPRVQYEAYNENGNPVTLSQATGPKVSYQWGYNGQYPVAMVLNAQNASVNSTQPVVGNGTLAVSTGGAVTFTTASAGNITLSLRLTSPPTRSFSVTFTLNSSSPDTFCFQLGGSPSVCGGSAHATTTLTNMPAGTYTLSISSIFDTSPNNPSPLFATIDFNYPSSQIVTTGTKEFFYESFEEGAGNSAVDDAKTGHFSYSGSYSKELSGLSSRNYILSYWQKTANGWILQKQQPVAVTSGSYSISIPAGQVDDVRFYPVDAQMTTYTYDPQVGMTSTTDPKDQTIYYEYDGFLRLIDTKDKNRNIVKHTEYHYQVQ